MRDPIVGSIFLLFGIGVLCNATAQSGLEQIVLFAISIPMLLFSITQMLPAKQTLFEFGENLQIKRHNNVDLVTIKAPQVVISVLDERGNFIYYGVRTGGIHSAKKLFNNGEDTRWVYPPQNVVSLKISRSGGKVINALKNQAPDFYRRNIGKRVILWEISKEERYG